MDTLQRRLTYLPSELVLALEIVGGRASSDPNLEEEKIFLLEWV